MKKHLYLILFWLIAAGEGAAVQFYLFADYGLIGLVLTGLTALLIWGILITLPRKLIAAAVLIQGLFFWLLLIWHSHYDDPLSLKLISTSFGEGLKFAALAPASLITLPVIFLLLLTAGQMYFALKKLNGWTDKLPVRLICGIPLLFMLGTAGKFFYKEGFIYTDFKFITRTAGYPSGWFYELMTDFQSALLFEEIIENANLPTPPLPPELQQIKLPDHLFVIQVESLDYAGYQYPGAMPFLQQTAAQSYVYTIRERRRNQSANSDFMILSKANNFEKFYFAIYTLLPKEEYQKFASLPRKAEKLGYQTAFYHGFSKRFYQRGKGIASMGFNQVWFWDNLPVLAPEGAWGYDDGDLFDFALKQDRQAGGKMLHMIVTVSSHETYDIGLKQTQPFARPQTLQEKYYNSLNYVDASLRRLIESAPQSSLFFIYSDHHSGEDEDTRTLLYIYDKSNPQGFKGEIDFNEVPLLLHGLLENSVDIPREDQPAVRKFLGK